MTKKRSIMLVVTSMIIVSGIFCFQSQNDKTQVHTTYARSALPSQYEIKPLDNESSSSTSDGDTTSSSSSISSSAATNATEPSNSKKTTRQSVVMSTRLPKAGTWVDDFQNVKQNDDFKTSAGTSLAGAQINITNGNVLNGNGGTDTISNHPTDIAVSTAAANVMGAKAGEGFGTWLYRMGTKDTAGSSVKLTVPGSSAKEVAAYRTTLTWTLTDSPAS
ncbi:WxL domain-containing protein [Leuconostoc gasicomitatum]|nr:WxL domain-containing protein [Leuconostoc gasicomitatum]MBZ5946328.1 WxL domain-containing protein [Leuconostoc gasicomitatum]MBZ5950153.1 WxL domain-containing protein [Leuconostoc gasicomitatum]MBZ5954387.1 WxL domain-containing protein [Leuconostoc gasicomitatum]MBZ5973546.1 WxL domain-containing protein [Leuconostoc gasicomitatum]MBZ5997619.1 WxL domain-containing protein [Leuconostoc gasicomitatum]